MAEEGDDDAEQDARMRKKPNEVRDDIEERYFDKPAGFVLPGIGAIAKEVQAGRGTVEQALDQLQMEGRVVYRATKGFILTGFGFNDSIEKSELGQILEVRLAIEPLAARSAARAVGSNAATREVVEALHTAFRALTDAFDSARQVKAGFAADRAFHAAIFELSDNPFLYAAADRINHWLTRNVEDVVGTLFADAGYRRDTQAEHEAMYVAITGGDQDAAFAAALTHLTVAHGRIMRKLRGRSR